MWRITGALLVGLLISKVARAQSVDEDFTPNIEASCKAGYMQINVYVNNLEYRGAVHARDFRRPECMAIGDGSGSVTLRLPLITDKDDPSYCGVRVNQTSKEKYVPIAVRIHETLELADDKFYVIKCGLQGFFNSKNETSFVGLQLLDPEHKKTKEAVFDRKYILRADMSRPDTAHSMRVKNCFSFGEPNYTAPLTDGRGCPVGSLISPFVYNETSGTAEAVLRMFKFPASNRVHFQCDVLICKGPCKNERCVGQPERLTEVQGRALPDSSVNSVEEKSGMVQATTTVYVVEPSSAGLQTCEWYPPWLWILCIVLAVLFIIMMIINIFLCSAMTCSCTKTEVIEKEPSIIEEYDPYRSWHGSQYGSRYSLNGKGYTSGASTMNSARSVSSHSDHYAIVHSRPNSRYSGHHSLKHDKHHHHHRGPPSTTGSHYSGKY
ncbi:uncharacterized protein LOC119590885 [Penaeus monodon]|uniref:uncharacterized protein LOC119590885 n=1 Tax=Penaeus monodon TaxID=6687 RepID=UPI0018A7A2EA|nr:uncharacterized protein LOC119590885 [Penaeus monodon]